MEHLPAQQTAPGLRDHLIDRAYELGKGGIPVSAAAVAGVVVIEWIEKGQWQHPVWLWGMSVLILLRWVSMLVQGRYGRHWPLQVREQLFLVPLTLTSLFWAALPVIVFPGATSVEKLAMVSVMSGMAGGAATVLSSLHWSGRLYLTCILLPGSFLIHDTPGGGLVLAVLGFCFWGVMLLSHHKLHRALVQAFEQGETNRRLMAEAQANEAEMNRLNQVLLEAQSQLRTHNAELTHEVAEHARKMKLAYSVVNNTTEGVLVLDTTGMVVEVNPAFTRITGYEPVEVLGQPVSLVWAGAHSAPVQQDIWQVLHQTGRWDGEIWSQRKDGSPFLERRSLDALRNEQGEVLHYVSIFNDISDQHAKDEKLRHLAFHDPLTGLANRALLQDRLEHGIGQAQRHGKGLAVLYLDLDQFKSVNDSMGHHVGDQLLCQVAQRLRLQVRASDTLARIGGDEFVVLMTDVEQPDNAEVLASKLLDAIDEPLELDGNRLHIRTSIGIALCPQDGTDAKTLMKCADMAMYAAKAAGRNTLEFFHQSLSEQAELRMQMEMALREAIEQEQFQLHYQAKFDAATGQVVGYEALLRWRHPHWGNVSPDRFIPVAEDAGLIGAIGEKVIAMACAQLAHWQQQGFGWQKMAINVSVRQLEHDDLIGLISMELQRHQVPFDCLQVEVTESVLVAKPEQTLPVLRRLRELGVKVAIDDFGTGHSSLAYLYRLPVDVLKIDKTFVQHMEQDESALAVVRTILSLSKTLQLQTVAEGVETTRQAEVLRESGCDVFQGYLFARPEPAAHIESGWRSLSVH